MGKACKNENDAVDVSVLLCLRMQLMLRLNLKTWVPWHHLCIQVGRASDFKETEQGTGIADLVEADSGSQRQSRS